MENFCNKKVMLWTSKDVSEWVDSVSREREMNLCGYIFEEKNIDGQTLWDYHSYDKLKDLNVPSIGLRLTLGKNILNLIRNDYQ